MVTNDALKQTKRHSHYNKNHSSVSEKTEGGREEGMGVPLTKRDKPHLAILCANQLALLGIKQLDQKETQESLAIQLSTILEIVIPKIF